MVSRRNTQKGARRHLYIDEWMTHLGVTDDSLGETLNVSRITIWRWRTEQHRLDVEKIATLSRALGVRPVDLYRDPGRRSVDAILESATAKQIDDTIDFVRRFVLSNIAPIQFHSDAPAPAPARRAPPVKPRRKSK